MTNRRADDIGMALVRALRPEADVERNARVERAIDNQGNPIMDNVVLVAGGPGGTVIVTFGAIQGDPGDNAALAAALEDLEEQITESSHSHANKAILDQVTSPWTTTKQSTLENLISLAVLVSNSDASPWNFVLDEDDMASNSGTKLATQASIKAYVDANVGDGHTHSNKATLDDITSPWTTLKQSTFETLVDLAVLITNSSVSGWNWVVDEDDMASDTATKVPTQQSVKAYVDANVGSGTVDWGDVNDKPSEFPPESHQHNASDVNAGTFNAARIPNLPASRITSGTLDIDRIPNLTASKIVLGVIDPAHIPSGSAALGTQVSTTSTSNQTVTALNISAAANAEYQVTYVVQCGCDGAGGIRLGVNAPSGSDVSYTINGSVGAASGADWTGEFSAGAGIGLKGWGQNATLGGGTIPTGAATITAMVRTGGTSGNISLIYRANTSGQTSIIGTGTKVSWVRTG